MNREKMIAELTRDEACKLVAYDDATGTRLMPGVVCHGHPTIGIGRALDVHGITQAEALYLAGNDIDSLSLELGRKLPSFQSLNDVRQRVLINMAFNMGVAGLLGFPNMLTAIGQERYDLAASEMENSAWCRQVGSRAVRLAAMMRSGCDWNPPAEMAHA